MINAPKRKSPLPSITCPACSTTLDMIAPPSSFKYRCICGEHLVYEKGKVRLAIPLEPDIDPYNPEGDNLGIAESG